MVGTRRTTIYDVAKLAVVSPSTVSRTFARPGRVNADTANRILLAAEELGYRTKAISRTVTPASTGLLAFQMADITNPFYAQLARGAQVAAEQANYKLIILDTLESAAHERYAFGRVLPVSEGLIVCSTRLPDSALNSIAMHTPMLVVNRQVRGISNISPDNRLGMQQAIDLLHELGHTSVTYVSGPEASWSNGSRYRALRDYAPSKGISVHNLGPNRPDFTGGLEAAKRLAQKLPTAVITFDDAIAIGLNFGLHSLGYQVPKDISIIGFDGTLPSHMMEPQLTTVSVPTREMGRIAVSNLIALINGASVGEYQTLTMPTKLRIGGSTGPARTKQIV